MGTGKPLLQGYPIYTPPCEPIMIQRIGDEQPTEVDPNGKSAHEPGSKLDAGKCQAGVLHDFALALRAVADVGTMGANKYSRGGWQSVPNGEERYFDAMWRHLLASKHEELDQDSKLPHFAHFCWNALAILELRKRA